VDQLGRLARQASLGRKGNEVIQGLTGHLDSLAIQAHKDLLDRKVLKASRVLLDVLVPMELLGHKDREASRVSLALKVRVDNRVTLDRWEQLDRQVLMDCRVFPVRQEQLDLLVPLEIQDL